MIRGKISFHKVEIGMELCNMHYGFHNYGRFQPNQHIEEVIRIKNCVQLYATDGQQLIESTVRPHAPGFYYVNKMLVVLEVGNTIKAAWSFDSNRFGLVEFELDE